MKPGRANAQGCFEPISVFKSKTRALLVELHMREPMQPPTFIRCVLVSVQIISRLSCTTSGRCHANSTAASIVADCFLSDLGEVAASDGCTSQSAFVRAV